MSTYEKSVGIISDIVHSQNMAVHILDVLLDNRITTTTMRASADLFTRFHAHCRYLGEHGGEGSRYWYNAAVAYAVERDSWPTQLIEKVITIDGHDVRIDVLVPQSTRRASNAQLLVAYSVIVDAAKEKGIELPENADATSTD